MSIKRRNKTEEKKTLDKENRERMLFLFAEIWDERPHRSAVSGAWLGDEPMTTFFDHLLPKGEYPEYKYEKENIVLVTPAEHQRKTDGFPFPIHQELIDEAKQKFLYGKNN